MAKPSTSAFTMQAAGATVPDRLQILRDHRIPQHVPASLHEDVFSVPLEFSADPLVLVARDALKTGRVAGEKALEIARATLADETETLHKRHQLARDRTFAATKTGIEKMQAGIDKLHDKCTALDKFLLGPPAPITAVAAVQVAEARRALQSMEPGDRRKAILEAIAAGDLLTAQAVTRAPSYLVGVSDLELADYAQAWAARNHPAEVQQAKVFRGVLEHVERGGSLLLSFTISLSSTQIAEEAKRLSARATAAVAAAA